MPNNNLLDLQIHTMKSLFMKYGPALRAYATALKEKEKKSSSLELSAKKQEKMQSINLKTALK